MPSSAPPSLAHSLRWGHGRREPSKLHFTYSMFFCPAEAAAIEVKASRTLLLYSILPSSLKVSFFDTSFPLLRRSWREKEEGWRMETDKRLSFRLSCLHARPGASHGRRTDGRKGGRKRGRKEALLSHVVTGHCNARAFWRNRHHRMG